MVKFVIHTDVEEEKEQEVRLALYLLAPGCITLHVVNKEGNHISGSNILSINRDGQLRFHSSVNKQLGLKLDEKGKIEHV